MKKALLSIGLIALFLAPVMAQDLEVMESASDGKLMTKRGAPILPEPGDWGIGIDATPFLEYVGNAFNGNFSNAAPTWNFTAQNPLTIYGRKVQSDDQVMRALVRIGFSSISQETPNATDPTQNDEFKSSAFALTLGAGIEKNKSLANRLRGYYGGMAAISMNPYVNASGIVVGNTTVTDPVAGTEVKETGGSSFGVGVRGFVGAEYFFAPKMSIGGEFGWGLGFQSTSARENETAGTTTTLEGKSSALVVDNDNGALGGLSGPSGQLVLFIYF
jgi:hypothetical protein